MSEGTEVTMGRVRFRRDRAAALAVIAAAIVGPSVLSGVDGLSPSVADAARDDKTVMPPNAAAQRREMIDHLVLMEKRLASIEKSLSGGLEVRVSNFPEPEADDEDRGSSQSRRSARD